MLKTGRNYKWNASDRQFGTSLNKKFFIKTGTIVLVLRHYSMMKIEILITEIFVDEKIEVLHIPFSTLKYFEEIC